MESIESALKINSKDVLAWYVGGKLLKLNKKFDEAIKW